jgi:UDP-glucose 4-epimerase
VSQRDYIHVTDLVEAHVMLLAALKGTDLMYYNVRNASIPTPTPTPTP